MIRSRPARALFLTAAVAALLAGCQRDGQKADKAPAPEAQTAIEAPLTYESETPFAKVSLALPKAIQSQPELYKALYAQEVQDLMGYAEGAQADRTEAGSDAALPPYQKIITYSGVVQTGRLFSAVRSDFDYSGGAHPNTVATALLWDKTTGKRISAGDLLAKGADLTALERALCEAVNTAKKKRPGAAPVTTTSDTWSCPRVKSLAVALAPGSVEGKAGGLTFLLDAYAVGPYVEGPYYLTLPTSAFQGVLNPTYADEFAGQPAKTGDVTEDLRRTSGD